MTDKTSGARRLLLGQRFGVLSTLSADLEGYPFGSIVPYAVSHAGEPLILISTLAQHTRNLKRDRRVSLFIYDPLRPDPQEEARLTWVGEAEPVSREDEAAWSRYLAYAPDAEGYFEAHDFELWRIPLKRARYIGGFGSIHWIDAEDLVEANPFALSERRIVAHMNEDHAHNLRDYCLAFKGVQADRAFMIGIDAHGFDVLADGQRLRFEFDAPVTTPDEARQALVAMAKAARQSNPPAPLRGE